MSRASSAQSPDASALPARLTPSGPGNISGNKVSTVARQIVGSRVIPFNGASGAGRQTADGGPKDDRVRALVGSNGFNPGYPSCARDWVSLLAAILYQLNHG